jgi:U4/U6.U5 tri-snRNP-associated protein 3
MPPREEGEAVDGRGGGGGGGDGDAGVGGPESLDAPLTQEEIQMMQAMGVPFAFDTTQGQHVEDERANTSGLKVKSTRSARQFMNRRGGFNRPLPAERTGEKVARD